MTALNDSGRNREPAQARPVLVVGSANVDVSVIAAALPRPGETVVGSGSLISVGGKGANQAVAAAACGAATRLVGRVGSDAFGAMVCTELERRAVGCGYLLPLAGASTGLAAIYVDAAGQNCIVVVPGANALLAAADIDALRGVIGEAAVVVLQCEVPMATVYRTIEVAAECGTPVILNPAPFRGLELPRLLRGTTYLIPNETEAAQIAGAPVTSVAEAREVAAHLHAAGLPCVIVTLGARGCVVADEAGERHLPSHPVVALDTTGAGDAFVGCFAASLALGHARGEAIRRALLYAALSTTARGAQASFPGRGEFERAWAALPAGPLS